MMKSRPRVLLALAALLMGIFALATPSLALLVRPIIIDLNASGTGVNGQIEVVNDRNKPMAIEIKTNSFTLPERGELVLGADAGKDFLIFPAIAQLPPGGRQVFRIRYVGDPAIAQSKLYMFSSSELPVSDAPDNGKARIDVLYSISSVVAVRPPKSKAAISIASVERSVGPDKQPGIRILFQNKGAAHGYVGSTVLDLHSGAWRKSVSADDTGKAFGLGLVPAGARRSLFIPVANVPASGAIDVTIKAAGEV
ncbi:hypothetical protein GCM10022281_13170 [Sphingomonas rosea]|uniref:Molecular chaperone n=1 Tax=Sphingomonas rosea TaxID=335605 RepID=A0ABP7U1G5_9SPHN